MGSVLYLDDSEPDRKLAEKAFEREGMFLKCATSIEEAFSLLKSGNYDLVASDIVLKQDDGLYFLRQLAQFHPNIPVVFVSGVPSMIAFSDYSALPNYKGFITKPLTPEKVKPFLGAA